MPLISPNKNNYMKASAIRIDISEVVKLERAVPQVAIATATIKFQLKGNLSFLQDESIPMNKKKEKLSRLLLKALQEVGLD